MKILFFPQQLAVLLKPFAVVFVSDKSEQFFSLWSLLAVFSKTTIPQLMYRKWCMKAAKALTICVACDILLETTAVYGDEKHENKSRKGQCLFRGRLYSS